MAWNYKTTVDGVNFIKKWEAFSPRLYLDQGEKATIGYGHLIKVHEPYNENSVLSEPEAVTLLSGDLVVAEKAVNTMVNRSLTPNEFDALVSLVFNIGSGNFSSSALLVDLNKGEFVLAASRFAAWLFVQGKPSKGLLRRRLQEASRFLG